MNTLRVELRTRNNPLWQAIHTQHASVAAFCLAHGIDRGRVDGFLNLELDPVRLRSLHAAARLALPAAQEDVVFADERRETLREVLHTLKPRQERLLKDRYGLVTGEPMTLEEIAEQEGLTRERVRQVLLGAEQRLRHYSRAKQLKPFLEEGVG